MSTGDVVRHPRAGLERVLRVERHRAGAADELVVASPAQAAAGMFVFAGYTPPPPRPLRPRPQRPAARRRQRLARQAELPLPKLPRRMVLRDNLRPLLDRELPILPATRGDCLTTATNPRVSGICPVFSCRHNLALWVKDNGAIKIEGAADTKHPTLRSHRRVSDRTLERFTDMIIDRADRLGISLCTLDLADAIADERVNLRTLEKDHADAPDWTYALIARIKGVSAERARVLGHEAERSMRAALVATGIGPEGYDPDEDEEDDDGVPAVLAPPETPPLVMIRRRREL